jgi:site-specific recombinase XerD
MMLPQCSHIARKRGVYYYRRRLPKPLTGEMALSLRTRSFLRAGWLAHRLDLVFPRVLRRMSDNKNAPEITRIVHQWLRDHLDNDLDRRIAASHSPVYASVDDGEDPVAADLAWVDAELDAAKTELTERLYEHQRPLIDYLMEEHKLPDERWNELAFAVFRANVKKWETIRKRTLGDLETWGPSALSPPSVVNGAPVVAPPETGPLLSSVLPGFIEFMADSEGWRGQTLAQNQTTYRMFVECCGDHPVTAYQRKDLTKFYDLLRSLPKLYSKAREWRGLSLAEIANQSREQNIERITMKTVKRHFSALGRLFAFLKRRGEITGENPAYGFEFPDKQRAKEKRKDWSSDELAKLFMTPVWTGCHSASRRSRPGKVIIKDEKYWLPILSVYHGNRLEEFAQLRGEDVRHEDGIHFFDINDDGTKQVKNEQSKRRVPIHRAVQQMGFLQYVEQIAPNPSDLIFPQLLPGGPDRKLGFYFTKWWTDYRKEVGLYDPKLNYHSFRHNVTTKLAAAAVPLEIRNELLGREGKSIDERIYLKRLPLKMLADAINQIHWPELKHLVQSPGEK